MEYCFSHQSGIGGAKTDPTRLWLICISSGVTGRYFHIQAITSFLVVPCLDGHSRTSKTQSAGSKQSLAFSYPPFGWTGFVDLSWECRRHVANMSPTDNNVGKILPAGQCRDTDIIFFVAFPAHFNVGKCRHFIVMQKYRATIEYIYQQTTTNSSRRHPRYFLWLFPPLFSWVQQRRHPITARRFPTPCAGRKPSRFGWCRRFDRWGGQKERDRKIERRLGGCLGLRVAAIFWNYMQQSNKSRRLR